MQAYDIQMPDRPVDRADSADRGWCFGLPPGIEAAQWPLDRNNGYPAQLDFATMKFDWPTADRRPAAAGRRRRPRHRLHRG